MLFGMACKYFFCPPVAQMDKIYKPKSTPDHHNCAFGWIFIRRLGCFKHLFTFQEDKK